MFARGFRFTVKDENDAHIIAIEFLQPVNCPISTHIIEHNNNIQYKIKLTYV